MNTQDILKKLPTSGFLKISGDSTALLTGEKRVALIRKGNELFNRGEFSLAERIFMTTKYTDGLIRMGDHYVTGGKPLEALRLYWLAPAPDKTSAIVEKIAQVMKQWLAEGKTETQ